MRKLRLLLSVGTMLSLAAGAANAEMFAPNAPGSDQSPTGTSMVTTTSGFQEVGSPYTGGQGQQYTPTASAYNSSPFSTPNPGTVNLRVDLQTVMYGTLGWWTGMNGSGVSSSATLNGASTQSLGNKQAPYAIVGYVRIDLGLDGMSKSGVRYGAFTEIRENSTNPNSTVVSATSTTAAGTAASTTSAGANTASTTSSGTSGFNGQETLYVRQAWAYIGTDQLGIVRIGQGFSANSVLQTGLNDEFDAGGWVGFQAGALPPSATGPTWPWADSGNEYQAARIAYLSPVLAGFDAVVSFAPNNLPATSGGNICSSVYTGCISQTTSSAASDLARYRNEFEVGARYRNTFGPVGLAVSGVYTKSAATNAVPGTLLPSAAVGGAPLRYNGLNMGMVGAEITINKYLAIGANTLFGDFNGSWGLQNKAGYCAAAGVCQPSTTTAIAWVAGARYTIPQLPLTVGGSYFNYKYQGQPGLPTQRTSAGVDLGAVYGLGPGAILIAEYLWGYNYQGGYNFLTSSAASSANNKVQEQMFLAGIALRF